MKLDYVAYMENIAIKNKAIQHVDEDGKRAFFRNSSITSLDEFFQNMTDIKLPCLMANDFISSKIDRNTAGVFIERCTYLFYVVDKPENNSAKEEQKVKDNTKLIIKKIIGKMDHDGFNDRKGVFPKTNLRNFEVDAIIEPLGPIGDNLYGNYCQLSIQFPINSEIKYDADEWL